MIAILSIFVRNLDAAVWAELHPSVESFEMLEDVYYNEGTITEFIPFGGLITVEHKKIAILNHHINKGFILITADTFDTENSGVKQTDYYLQQPQRS